MKKIRQSATCLVVFFLTMQPIACTNDEPAPLAEVTTATVSNISYTEANGGGTVVNDGGSSVTARGVCWSVDASPTINDSKTTDGAGGGTFNSSITGLSPNTTYFVRAYASNSNGTGYGISFSFTTKASTAAILTTSPVINGIGDKATSGGNVTFDGGAAVSVKGVCWGTSQNPTVTNNKTVDGAGVGTFTSNLTGLTPGITYYARAYATNSVGTSYGNELSFITSTSIFTTGPTDNDGNVYTAVSIGTQVWMVENLKTTKYANGDPIPNVTSGSQWVLLTTGAWSYYANDQQYNSQYGKLYNWYAVTDPRNVCPTGWHAPSQIEWVTLIDYLGGETIAGGKMKEAGSEHWNGNIGATNNSGFTGLPGGVRGNGSAYFGLGTNGTLWSTTESVVLTDAKCILLRNNSSVALANNVTGEKQGGMTVRCVKD